MTSSGSKAALRTEMLVRRAGLPDLARTRLGSHLARCGPDIVRGHGPAEAMTASAFLPIRNEPDCMPLLQALQAASVRTALPVTPAGRGLPLRFRSWQPGEPLVPGRWSIPEPDREKAEIDPDVLFVPLAAFDRTGHRLGYGAGFYDGALAALRARKPVLAVGVAFSVQEVDAVPAEAHDERLDMIVTEDAVHVVAKP